MTSEYESDRCGGYGCVDGSEDNLSCLVLVVAVHDVNRTAGVGDGFSVDDELPALVGSGERERAVVATRVSGIFDVGIPVLDEDHGQVALEGD